METAMHRPPFGQVRWSTYYSYCRYPLLVARPSVIPKPDLILTRFSIHPFLNFPIFSSFEETREHDQLNRSIKNEERRTIRLVPDDGFPKRKERDQVESIAVSKIRWQTGGLAALRMRSIVKLRIDSDLATTPTFPPSFRHALLRSRARTIPVEGLDPSTGYAYVFEQSSTIQRAIFSFFFLTERKWRQMDFEKAIVTNMYTVCSEFLFFLLLSCDTFHPSRWNDSRKKERDLSRDDSRNVTLIVPLVTGWWRGGKKGRKKTEKEEEVAARGRGICN